MFEIELKAHVHERQKVIDALNAFAAFSEKVERHDTYWHIPSAKAEKGYISARIRREKVENKETVFLTYKRKELIESTDGKKTEVNDEKECTLSNAKAIEALFTDAGFLTAATKDKIVYDWTCTTPSGKATLELCTVPPLGDFLEIEILSPSNDEKTTEKAQKELYNLLEKSGISVTAVENRYYTEMLKETADKKNGGQNV